jgi:hypothetical protein
VGGKPGLAGHPGAYLVAAPEQIGPNSSTLVTFCTIGGSLCPLDCLQSASQSRSRDHGESA